MTEVPDDRSITPTFSQEMALEFLSVAGADRPCPSCGQTEWQAWSTETQIGIALIGIEADGKPAPSNFEYLPVYPFGCGSCGFVKLHSIYHMKSVMDART